MPKIPSNIKKSKLLRDYIGETRGYIWNIQKIDDYYYRTNKRYGNWLAIPVVRKGYSGAIMQCRLYGWTLKDLSKKLEDWEIPEDNTNNTN